MHQLLARLDAFGADDPDNNEGFIEDRCSIDGVPIVDHPCFPHRWRALVIMAIQRWS